MAKAGLHHNTFCIFAKAMQFWVGFIICCTKTVMLWMKDSTLELHIEHESARPGAGIALSAVMQVQHSHVTNTCS